VPTIQIAIDGIYLTIPVPCEQRARLYENYLKSAAVQLIEYLGLKSVEQKLVIQQAIEDIEILSFLARKLDYFVLLIAENEISEKRKVDKRWNWTQVNSYDYGEARELLKQYYDEELIPQGKQHEVLQKYFKLARDNVIANIIKAMDRALEHFENLQLYFLGNDRSELRLNKIYFVDSDPHKGGQQVLILEFHDAQDESYAKKLCTNLQMLNQILF